LVRLPELGVGIPDHRRHIAANGLGRRGWGRAGAAGRGRRGRRPVRRRGPAALGRSELRQRLLGLCHQLLDLGLTLGHLVKDRRLLPLDGGQLGRTSLRRTLDRPCGQDLVGIVGGQQIEQLRPLQGIGGSLAASSEATSVAGPWT